MRVNFIGLLSRALAASLGSLDSQHRYLCWRGDFCDFWGNSRCRVYRFGLPKSTGKKACQWASVI